MYLQNSRSDRQREKETHRKREVETPSIAVQQKALNEKKHLKVSFNVTPSVPLDNPNSGRQTVRVLLKLLTPSETQA